MEQCPPVVDSTQNYHLFSRLVPGALLTVIVVLGIAGSIANLSIFVRESPSFVGLKPYLTALAVWDLMLLAFGWLIFAVPALIYGGELVLFGNIVFLYYWLYPLCNMAYTACALTNVIVCFERYLELCHPLRHSVGDPARRAYVLLFAAFLLAFVLNVPRFFEFYISLCTTSGSAYIALRDWLAYNNAFLAYYRIPSECLFTTIGPTVILTILTWRILRVLRVTLQVQPDLASSGNACCDEQLMMNPPKRRHGTAPHIKHMQLTSLLVALVAKFLLCHFAPNILNVMQYIWHHKMIDHAAFKYLSDCSNVLGMFHSATNFLVYYVFQPRFRQASCRLIKGRPKPLRDSRSRSSRSSVVDHEGRVRYGSIDQEADGYYRFSSFRCSHHRSSLFGGGEDS